LRRGPGVAAARPGPRQGAAAGRGSRSRPGGADVSAVQTVDQLVGTPLLTHEVGSLDKPSWRVKAFAGKPVDESDIELARVWGERVGVDGSEELIELLRRAPLESREDRERVRQWSSRYGLRMQEAA